MISSAWRLLTGSAVPGPVTSEPVHGASSMQTVDLLDAGWCLRSQDGKHCVQDAALPAQALQILHRAGVVGDPLAGCDAVADSLETQRGECGLSCWYRTGSQGGGTPDGAECPTGLMKSS
jgi:hypothetical protein